MSAAWWSSIYEATLYGLSCFSSCPNCDIVNTMLQFPTLCKCWHCNYNVTICVLKRARKLSQVIFCRIEYKFNLAYVKLRRIRTIYFSKQWLNISIKSWKATEPNSIPLVSVKLYPITVHLYNIHSYTNGTLRDPWKKQRHREDQKLVTSILNPYRHELIVISRA